MLLREIKTIYHKELDALYPETEVDHFFYWMVEHYLGLERFVLALQPQLVLTKEEEQPLFEGLAQLRQERPIQYIVGWAPFRDLELEVNEAVLIPRPETEELVQWVLDSLPHDRELNILDMGTGSGCIAIVLALALPKARVWALDISDEALEVAARNAQKYGAKVQFLKADILAMPYLEQRFDVVVSNPPYVRELEKEAMGNNVLQYEPRMALFVPDADPLRFYEKIAEFAAKQLRPNGQLFLEINEYLGPETQQLMEQKGLVQAELRHDIFGKDRMLRALAPEHV